MGVECLANRVEMYTYCGALESPGGRRGMIME